MKCKNIECENETIGKRVYCSLKCRNVYVNKHLRSYEKVSNTYNDKKNEKANEYLKEPKKCLFCAEVIPFDKRRNNYCNHSCSASHNNPERDYTWSDKIRKSIHNYLIDNKIKEKVGIYYLECKACENIFESKRKELMFCGKECRKEHGRRNMEEYKKYKQDTIFKFHLRDYPEMFDFTLVEKHGWYSPTNKKNNLNGVSRDHMLSVNEGFRLGIDPFLLAHPANCELMIHNENISKNNKSSLTLEDLLIRIKDFEKKYGKYEENDSFRGKHEIQQRKDERSQQYEHFNTDFDKKNPEKG